MKKAMLFVSFGSSYESARRDNIDKTVNYVAKNFEDYDVFQAYTSNMIRKKLNNQGIKIDSVSEALSKIKDSGYTKVVIVSLHIIAGFEYEKILEVVNDFNFNSCAITTPMLYDDKDYFDVATLVDKLFNDLEHPVILMGHGSEHKNDISYDKLQEELDKIKSNKYYIATVEGKVTIQDIIAKLKNNRQTDVFLTPFMLVCGDHANNDMAGDEDDSWINILKSEDIVANPVLKGLGEYEEVAKFFINKIKSKIFV